MIDFDSSRDVMSKPFDIATHKRTFQNYLEVVIDEEGQIHYATPSHADWLIDHACTMYNTSRTALMRQVPRKYYFDMLTYWTKITHCVAVWDIGYVGELNKLQKSALELLQLSGLYFGRISPLYDSSEEVNKYVSQNT